MRASTIYLPLCLLGLVAASGSSAAPAVAGSTAGAPTEFAAPRGQYVEARTASVYAGACHYGSEYTTCGREAVLVWHFEGGTWNGVDLTGVNVALAVASDENLDEAAGARHALVYSDAHAERERRAAAVDFVLTRWRGLAGDVRAVKCAELSVAFDAETYSAAVPGAFELRGAKLENRECCKMPYNVWYSPFVELVQPIVGCNAVFSYTDDALGTTWKRARQNETFVGRFDAAPVVAVHSEAKETAH